MVALVTTQPAQWSAEHMKDRDSNPKDPEYQAGMLVSWQELAEHV